MKNITENTKFTLTLKQIKELLKEIDYCLFNNINVLSMEKLKGNHLSNKKGRKGIVGHFRIC